MNDIRVDYCERALIQLLIESLPAAYGQKVDVEGLGDNDFDEEGQLILKPPSVRVRFTDAPFNNLRDNQRLTYQAMMHFEIWCFQSSLRGAIDQRKQTLVLVAAAQDMVAGARLALPDGSKTMPVSLDGVRLVNIETPGVDQLFSIDVTVEGIAQFSGANA